MATANVTRDRHHCALGRVDERSHDQHRAGSGHERLRLQVPEQHRRLPEVAPLGLAEQERGVPRRHDSRRDAEPRHRLDEAVGPERRTPRNQRLMTAPKASSTTDPRASHDVQFGLVNR